MAMLPGAIIPTFVEEGLLDPLIAGRFEKHGLLEQQVVSSASIFLCVTTSTKSRVFAKHPTAIETAPMMSFSFLDLEDVKTFHIIRADIASGWHERSFLHEI
jgi:hypothetical protein